MVAERHYYNCDYRAAYEVSLHNFAPTCPHLPSPALTCPHLSSPAPTCPQLSSTIRWGQPPPAFTSAHLPSPLPTSAHLCSPLPTCQITCRVMASDPWHAACLPVHLALLVELRETNTLFKVRYNK